MLLAELIGVCDIAQRPDRAIDDVLFLDCVLAERMLELEQQNTALLHIRSGRRLHRLDNACCHLVLGFKALEPIASGISHRLHRCLAPDAGEQAEAEAGRARDQHTGFVVRRGLVMGSHEMQSA